MASFDESFDIESAAKLFCGNHDDNANGQVLAMAYVPWQQWQDLYDEETALQRGTLFAQLDKPFLGRKQVRNG